jgi:glycosyltransferase involved in cell wall biosynthesis
MPIHARLAGAVWRAPAIGLGAMIGHEVPIKLVFLIDNMRLGGTELNAVRTAQRLNRQKFDLRIVCLGADGPLTTRYREMGIPVTHLPVSSFYGPSMLSSGLRFARLLRRERAEIVHAHDVYSNIFAAVWARAARVRVLVASRRWWHSLPNRKLQLGNRLAFFLADVVLANSPQVARTLRERDKLPASKVWTVTNFADDEAFGVPSEPERVRLRREWNAPADSVVIGCVARLDPVKDHATLLRGFAALRQRHPHIFLVLIGDGEARLSLEKLASDLELGDVTRFTGELTGGRNYHRGLDISVLTSLSEGFPNSLVEAMAAGNPVVATAVGGSVDAVVDGLTGLLVQPGDPAGLAAALSRLVADGELRRAMGKAGIERASAEYNAAAVVSRLESMYVHLVGRP